MLRNSAQRIAGVLGLPLLPVPDVAFLAPHDVAEARQYIAGYWQKLERISPKDQDTLIGVPQPYLVPADESSEDFNFDELYYWDSYFMAQGLLDARHQRLVEGMLDDLTYLYGRFGIVPNANRTYLTGRSQPPLLTSLIFDIYRAFGKDDDWLQDRIVVAQKEYFTVWMASHKPHMRQVYKGLSRNYAVDMTHDAAEAESGWDYTPRFQRRALDFLPVDLNAFLYKYEMDFAEAARLKGDANGHDMWLRAARRRKQAMAVLMWDRRRGLFYDYDYKHHHRGPVSSLAAYATLWSGLATRRQARAMVWALRRFEYAGGLATTDDIPLNQRLAGGTPTQWAYPNGWAPLHWLVVQGLEHYGYHRDARRIASKWLRANLAWFNAHGVFQEKYNVVNPDDPPAPGVYPSQTGFGWTNAIFERLCREYVDHNRS